ncbi:cell division protein ZipA C-terminal FtsZ-binding domain-containing protein [Nitrosospira sp. Nsp1]|uniref:cell division protein ZipA C-terminal FtsZ-binding domain-containing protein n=1 Tax=Nitrosospira sp. Nsp1 TaxID=136547 RepID=UPI0021097CE9|nr:cell division protein ZipA C-terminal FtsZ-binding domain-containing protein [Nitrosospira sp. Nsp1]
MSELQISLIAIGIIVVMGVVFFNWMQQRRYRRGAEEAFGPKHEDVLLRETLSGEQNERIEPQLDKAFLQEPRMEPRGESTEKPIEETNEEPNQEASQEPSEELSQEPAEAAEITQPKPEPAFGPARTIMVVEQEPVPLEEDNSPDSVDYVIEIRSEKPIMNSSLAEVLQRKFDFSKPVRWLGQRSTEAFWEEITTEANGKGGYTHLRGCLQLADRAGPVSEVSLSEFRDMAENFATHVAAAVNCPNIHKAYARAILLDEFCTQVDVMVGINIISKDNSVFTGAKIRVLAETSGFKLGAEGLFHYRDENNVVLFSLGNYEPSPFLPGSVRTLTTRGITFLLDVPGVANGEAVFGQMMHLAGIFTDNLGGVMVDDNRIPLSDSGIRKIKQQLVAIQSTMLSRNIPAGGETALRLFA